MRGVLPDEVLCGAKKAPTPKTWNPGYLAAVSAELTKVIEDPAAPLLRVVRADALEQLLASGAENPVPWYGQLMMTPQTIAWFFAAQPLAASVQSGTGVNGKRCPGHGPGQFAVARRAFHEFFGGLSQKFHNYPVYYHLYAGAGG